jgi:hypothetical protein
MEPGASRPPLTSPMHRTAYAPGSGRGPAAPVDPAGCPRARPARRRPCRSRGRTPAPPAGRWAATRSGTTARRTWRRGGGGAGAGVSWAGARAGGGESPRGGASRAPFPSRGRGGRGRGLRAAQPQPLALRLRMQPWMRILGARSHPRRTWGARARQPARRALLRHTPLAPSLLWPRRKHCWRRAWCSALGPQLRRSAGQRSRE